MLLMKAVILPTRLVKTHYLTLTILRASTTKAPKFSLKTFLLLRSKDWLMPLADITRVKAVINISLRP